MTEQNRFWSTRMVGGDGLRGWRTGNWLVPQERAVYGDRVDLTTALRAHLYPHQPVNGLQYKSSLIALLGDARGAADRDGETGEVEPGKRSASWLGAVGYLVLLDQVGTCFKVRGQRDVNERAFVHAVRTFSHVRDDLTVLALYALRCALAHDYALYNDGGGARPLLRHAFNFCADTTSPLVQLPARTWSGTYGGAPAADETTIVNLRKVGDLAEQVVAELRARHVAGTLDVRLPLDQFHMRYGLAYRA